MWSHFQQPSYPSFFILTFLDSTMPRSIFFSFLCIAPLCKNYVTYWSGPNTAGKPPASGAFRCHRNRCKTCSFITGTTSHISLPANNDVHIRHHMTCSGVFQSSLYAGYSATNATFNTWARLNVISATDTRAIENAITQTTHCRPAASRKWLGGWASSPH